jgi:hypothetical protein
LYRQQIASLPGAWLGGYLFDRLESCHLVRSLSVAPGIVAGLLNLPIDKGKIQLAATAGPAQCGEYDDRLTRGARRRWRR